MHEHTFRYTDQANFIAQLDEMRIKLTEPPELESYHIVRARYPRLSDTAFAMRLKRFPGRFPREYGKCHRKTSKLFVTPVLDAYLRKNT
ncbi:MAG: hypothetical protein QOE26_2739 [Verrucomicrobiota bacterium]